MIHIKRQHIEFAAEAAEAFRNNFRLETYRDKDDEFIGLRYGLDRDCVAVYELGVPIANFVQWFEANPAPRNSVAEFALRMEQQLVLNEYKGGWGNADERFLLQELHKNLSLLEHCKTLKEYRRRCANIANFAMMLAENSEHEFTAAYPQLITKPKADY